MASMGVVVPRPPATGFAAKCAGGDEWTSLLPGLSYEDKVVHVFMNKLFGKGADGIRYVRPSKSASDSPITVDEFLDCLTNNGNPANPTILQLVIANLQRIGTYDYKKIFRNGSENRTVFLGQGACGSVVQSESTSCIYKQATTKSDYDLIDKTFPKKQVLVEAFIQHVAFCITGGYDGTAYTFDRSCVPEIIGIYTDQFDNLHIKMTKADGEELRKYVQVFGVRNEAATVSIISSAEEIFKRLNGSLLPAFDVWISQGDAHHGNFNYNKTTQKLIIYDFGLSNMKFKTRYFTNNSTDPSTIPVLPIPGYLPKPLDPSYVMFLIIFIHLHFTSPEYTYRFTTDALINRYLSYFTIPITMSNGSRTHFNLYWFCVSKWCSIKYRHPFHIFYWNMRFMRQLVDPTTGDFSATLLPMTSSVLLDSVQQSFIFYPLVWSRFPEYVAYDPTKYYTIINFLNRYILIQSYTEKFVKRTFKVIGNAVQAFGVVLCGKRRTLEDAIQPTDYDETTYGGTIGIESAVSQLKRSGRLAADKEVKAVTAVQAAMSVIAEEDGTEESSVPVKRAKARGAAKAVLPVIANPAIIDGKDVKDAIDAASVAEVATASRAANNAAKIRMAAAAKKRAVVLKKEVNKTIAPAIAAAKKGPGQESITAMYRAAAAKASAAKVPMVAPPSKIRLPSRVPPPSRKKGGGRRTLRKKLKSTQTRKKSRSRSYNSRY